LKALIVGAGGQLAIELERTAPAGASVTSLGIEDLDIADGPATKETVERLRPNLILNAAAYTAVDRAETEIDLAFAANRDGPANLARAATATGARLVHVSTDFVFGGEAGRAYPPSAPTEPLGVYGVSKRDGEVAVAELAPSALIVRTAWVYSAGGANFVKTMLRLMRDRDEVRVVADQIGTPTWAADLARAIWGLVDKKAAGLFHFTNAGAASWYDFAVAIAEEAYAAGLLEREVRVVPIRTADYPTPARRPAFSVLDCSDTWAILGAPAPHWRVALRDVVAALASEAAR
jgi:dTDP-4-dehydrorhamnose reductase